jgi:hypothetical protein
VSQPSHYCAACFTGGYPCHVEEAVDKLGMERR